MSSDSEQQVRGTRPASLPRPRGASRISHLVEQAAEGPPLLSPRAYIANSVMYYFHPRK